ncbi:VCBS repeat-containing protein [candidate division KSB1 bacterium]|nr:VCBS repeat-containing protein [candidate division KSB1 bacterium]
MSTKLIVFLLIVMSPYSVIAQDLTQYEAVNISTIGIPKVLMDRWGAVSADIDENGWPDIFAVKWRGVMGSQLYMNTEGMFHDIYGDSPDLLEVEEAQNATRINIFADYDNDGDKDLLFGGDYDLFLFQNNNNVFSNVSDQTGVKGRGRPGFVSTYGFDGGAWADYDLDGDLDLVVCQTNNQDFFFFRNDGGIFTDIAEDVGLKGENPLGAAGDRGAYSARLQWIDYDLDGDPDLSAGWMLFRNDDGYFTEIAKSIGLTPDSLTFFQAWFDYDNDGDWDYFKLIHGSDDPGENSLWQNQDGHFVDKTSDVGLYGWRPHLGSSLNIGDYDNDCDEDIYIQINNHVDIDVLLLNETYGPDDHAFGDVAAYSGLTTVGDRKGATMLDYDMDGFLDIYVSSLEFGSIMYHNMRNSYNWIGLKLQGTQSNRDAIGTLVKVYTGDICQMRYTRVPNTWKIQDNQFIHVGIGEATSIDSIVIRWPLGLKEVFTDLAINQYHDIKEGDATSAVAQVDASLPSAYRLEQNYPNPFNAETSISYFIPEESFVDISIYDLRGQKIISLTKKVVDAGQHKIKWNGQSQQGSTVASGTYFCVLKTEKFNQLRKLVYLK